MAYDKTKPADGSDLVASEIRENFRALIEDDITIEGKRTFSKKPVFNAGVDLNKTQAYNLVIENRTSDPTSPVVGQVWFRTDV